MLEDSKKQSLGASFERKVFYGHKTGPYEDHYVCDRKLYV